MSTCMLPSVIRGGKSLPKQRSSEVIRGHQRSSEVIRGHQSLPKQRTPANAVAAYNRAHEHKTSGRTVNVKSDEPAVGPAGCALIVSRATSGACGGGGSAVVSTCMRVWVFKRLDSGERRQHVLATTRVHSKSVNSSELIGDHTSSSELIGDHTSSSSSSEIIRAHQSSSERT